MAHRREGEGRLFDLEFTIVDTAGYEDEDPDLAFVDAAHATDPLDGETADPDLADEDVEDDDIDAGERDADEDDGVPGAQPTRSGAAKAASDR